jgi:ABC-type nitrate/sulfonate/bicarbonate transport system permease component
MDAQTTAPAARAATDAKPTRGKSFWRRREHALLGTLSMLIFLAFWEAAVAFGWVNPLFTSSPSRIVRTAIDLFADGRSPASSS